MAGYSVIGYYADVNQPFIQHIEGADSPESAAAMAIARAEGDPVVVEVIEGLHYGTLDGDETLGRDWYNERAEAECDSCGSKWRQADLKPATDYFQRVDPGGVVPSGQCPDGDCGALCYPIGSEAA